jgi:poly-beta-1,6-N-acetyl-D-glucosamine biosynthesis protein PgaD
MRAEAPIISHPEKQSRLQKLFSLVLTIFAWVVWAYLWLPTLAVISAVFGMPINQILVVRRPDETSLLIIFAIMLTCNVVVSVWSSYNYVRFAKKSRRRRPGSTSHEEVGKAFGIDDPATLSLLSQGRSLSLYFDDAGRLVKVDGPKVKETRKRRRRNQR